MHSLQQLQKHCALVMRISTEHRTRLKWRLTGLLAALVLLIGLAVAWSSSPLSAWLDINLIVGNLQRLGASLGPVAAVGGFALAVSLAVPLTFLTLVTLVAFGPWAGFACAMTGALIGASVSYGFGRFLGHELVQRLAGAKVNILSQRLASRGVMAVVVVRLVPIAPFAIVNMIAGATHIRLSDMLIGTCIGMTPSTLVMMLFMDQILTALKQPRSAGWLFLVFTGLLIVMAAMALRLWIRRTGMQESLCRKTLQCNEISR